jgi:hypothetical protein
LGKTLHLKYPHFEEYGKDPNLKVGSQERTKDLDLKASSHTRDNQGFEYQFEYQQT